MRERERERETNTTEVRDRNSKIGLYSAVSSPHDCSKRMILYFPDRSVQSNTFSTSLGSIQPYVAINARRLLVHIRTTVYSHVLIHTQHTHTKAHTLSCTLKHTQSHKRHKLTQTYTHTHTHTHTNIHIIHIQLHKHAHAFKCNYTHTSTSTYIHTQTP